MQDDRVHEDAGAFALQRRSPFPPGLARTTVSRPWAEGLPS